MNFRSYLQPIDLPTTDETLLGGHVQAYIDESSFPHPEPGSVVLIGACETADRLCPADAVRNMLYRLVPTTEPVKLCDWGNLIPGRRVADTVYALAEMVASCVEAECTVVLLGGSQELAYALYEAYARLARVVNIANIDSRFDVAAEADISPRSWLYHVVLAQPNYLFNFTNLGHQSYFTGATGRELMEQLQFDAVRLGQMQQLGMQTVEPYIRWSDIVSVDMCAVRQSDAPGVANPSPHGLYGEQLCQLMLYAGLSEKNSCLGLFGLEVERDRDDQTAHLVAQALWHYLEGFAGRVGELPWRDKQQFRHFLVPLADGRQEIHFYKSRRTDRWWFEVPCVDDSDRYNRHRLIPCSYDDYQQALHNELPDRWWTIYNRVNH